MTTESAIRAMLDGKKVNRKDFVEEVYAYEKGVFFNQYGMTKLRMYPLEDKEIEELMELKDMVQTHPSLTFEEKKANLEAINSKLGVMTYNEEQTMAILKDIEDGQGDLDDIG